MYTQCRAEALEPGSERVFATVLNHTHVGMYHGLLFDRYIYHH